MTQAQSCLEAWNSQRGGLGRLARRFGLIDDVDQMPEGIRVFNFADGSQLLARGRGANHQVWIGEVRARAAG